ncbi:MAG: hypothetical protein QF464_19000, partial [Myxococcota bacterium]|nr:hypothetical protein [Myxococcota bacterium]
MLRSRLPAVALVLIFGLWTATCTGSGVGEWAGDAGATGDTGSVTDTDTLTDTGTLIDSGTLTDTATIPDTTSDTDTGGGLCADGVGCFGDPCESAEDCYSGLCGEHMGDTVCTKTCEDDCPGGWSCEQVDIGGDVPAYICVSNFEHLCSPCMETSDCTSESSQVACVDYDGQGAFCGAGCDADVDCPDGFVCQESESTRGGQSSQCVDVDGVCECSGQASALGLVTACSASSDLGACEGLRTCGPDGLSACDATPPAEETCNGLDDDCDGDVDEQPAGTGDACFEGVGGCRAIGVTICVDADIVCGARPTDPQPE